MRYYWLILGWLGVWRVTHLFHFEYTGATALTAVGPITGRRYRFPAPGAIVDVDERDASSLAAVPHLRRITRSGKTGD